MSLLQMSVARQVTHNSGDFRRLACPRVMPPVHGDLNLGVFQRNITILADVEPEVVFKAILLSKARSLPLLIARRALRPQVGHRIGPSELKCHEMVDLAYLTVAGVVGGMRFRIHRIDPVLLRCRRGVVPHCAGVELRRADKAFVLGWNDVTWSAAHIGQAIRALAICSLRLRSPDGRGGNREIAWVGLRGLVVGRAGASTAGGGDIAVKPPTQCSIDPAVQARRIDDVVIAIRLAVVKQSELDWRGKRLFHIGVTSGLGFEGRGATDLNVIR
jgi:hypothetical protein